jgi:glutamyl/glutaminyl-tRNA synthetase
MNHKYIDNLTSEEIYKLCKTIGVELNSNVNEKWWLNFISLTKEHFDALQDVKMLSKDFFEPFVLNNEILDELKKYYPLELLNQILNEFSGLEDWKMDVILNVIRERGKMLNIKGKNLYLPLRLAVTGRRQGLEG